MNRFDRIILAGFAFTVFGLFADLASAATPAREGTTVKCSIVVINGDTVISCPKVAR